MQVPDWLEPLLDFVTFNKEDRKEYLQIWTRTLLAVVVVGVVGFLFLKSCGTFE